MSKIRIKVEAYLDFEPNFEYYNEGATLEDVIKVELDNIQEDTLSYLENSNFTWNFSAENIE